MKSRNFYYILYNKTMEDIENKISSVVNNEHFPHALGLGAVAFGVTKYMEKRQKPPPAPQLVQIASTPRNTTLIVTLGVIIGSYMYMSKYGHNLPTTSE
jgi:hypothetical protein